MADPTANDGVPTAEFSKEYVDDLKAQLAAKTEAEALMRAKYAGYESRQRAQLLALQPTVQEWVSEGLENAGEHKNELEVMAEFGNGLHEANPESALPLARMISVHSAKVKRSREEFSANKATAEDLGKANAKVDELSAEVATKTQRINELEALSKERQALAESLQTQLANAGLLKESYNFSLPSARETSPPENLAPAANAPVAAASRGAVAFVDPLLSFVTSSGNGTGRMNLSNTSHHLLGTSSNADDVASMLRSI